MSSSLHAGLLWLLPAPADFGARCRSVPVQGDIGNQIRGLANFHLDENQLFRLAAAIGRARDSGVSLKPLESLRLGVLSNATADFVTPAIAASAARYGLEVQTIQGNYDQILQEALSPASPICFGKPDVVLLAIDYRWYPFHTCPGDAEQAEAVVDSCIAQLDAVVKAIETNSGAACIVQTLAPPVEGLFGNLDRALPGTMRQLIDAFNRKLAQLALNSRQVLFDVEGLAQTVGLAAWHDPTAWNMAKVPFSHEFLPLYADHVGRLLGTLRGKSRRCLILDLDNTIWGGVIGDDGVEGIQIGQGDATGEAFLSVQRLALELRSRGVALAVSSKNTDSIARKPFEDHPGMLLRLEHIAVFQANWSDKANNIEAIAKALSLGLESMVFLDDNPIERDLVRRMLPAVAVPELPTDAALYARTLAAAGYFEAVRFSGEDLTRAEFYQNNSRRIALRQQAADLNSWLASLDMEISFQPFDGTGRTRIAQLISKSNQFNLTTRRYSEAQIAALQSDPECLTLQVRLSDTFGDNGMISVIVCRRTDEETLEFDTWLMSCRVLGRGVEQMVLQEVIDYARKHRILRLVGRYIPTGKNRLVEDHYRKLGFELVELLQDQSAVWKLEIATASTFTAPMKVRRMDCSVCS